MGLGVRGVKVAWRLQQELWAVSSLGADVGCADPLSPHSLCLFLSLDFTEKN